MESNLKYDGSLESSFLIKVTKKAYTLFDIDGLNFVGNIQCPSSLLKSLPLKVVWDRKKILKGWGDPSKLWLDKSMGWLKWIEINGKNDFKYILKITICL